MFEAVRRFWCCRLTKKFAPRSPRSVRRWHNVREMVDLPVPASPFNQKTQELAGSSTQDMTSSRTATRVSGVHPSVAPASHVAEETGLSVSSRSESQICSVRFDGMWKCAHCFPRLFRISNVILLQASLFLRCRNVREHTANKGIGPSLAVAGLNLSLKSRYVFNSEPDYNFHVLNPNFSPHVRAHLPTKIDMLVMVS
jgi:hypothetical protein